MANVNPYRVTAEAERASSDAPRAQRSALREVVLAVIPGPIIGIGILFLVIVESGHGGLSPLGGILLGPSLWIELLLPTGQNTVAVLMLAQVVVWVPCWLILLGRLIRLPIALRIAAVSTVHVVAATLYQAIIGLP